MSGSSRPYNPGILATTIRDKSKSHEVEGEMHRVKCLRQALGKYCRAHRDAKKENGQRRPKAIAIYRGIFCGVTRVWKGHPGSDHR